MQITLVFIGKTKEDYISAGIADFEKRMKRYCPFTIVTIRDKKTSKSSDQVMKIKSEEAKTLFNHIKPNDFVVLLDERGKEFTSVEFAKQMQKFMNTINTNLVFVIGGAFGFDQQVYNRADFMLSLSKLTFSHQMVRLFFVEQLYRAMTILKNEPYHH